MLRTKRDTFQAEEDRLAREVDAPALLELLKQNAILSDDDAKRVARAHAEARLTFDRAWSGLQKALDREREDQDKEMDDDDSNDCSEPCPGVAEEASLRCERPDTAASPQPASSQPGGDPPGAPVALLNEHENAPEASSQVVPSEADSTSERGADRVVPLGATGGARDDHERREPPSGGPEVAERGGESTPGGFGRPGAVPTCRDAPSNVPQHPAPSSPGAVAALTWPP